MSLRYFSSVLSNLTIPWHRITASIRCSVSSKPTGTVETTPSALDGSDNLAVESQHPSAVVDAIDKEQLVLPYSQKALETLK